MKVIYLLRYAVVPLLCLVPVQATFAASEVCNTNILLQIPKHKAHVGVIPYLKQNNKIYVLLGRERLDGKNNSSGKYADFGGQTELDGTSLITNTVRELYEETMGQLKVSEKELLKLGQLLCSNLDRKKPRYYMFFPLSEADIKLSKKFNAIRGNLDLSKVKITYAEKDQFYWFALDDVMQQLPEIHDIDGNLHSIKFREFFVHDFLQHPDLSEIVANLK